MKKILAGLAVGVMLVGSLAGCGSKADDTAKNLEGSCSEILAQVYENAELEADLREAMQYYENTAIPEEDETESYMIGTNDVDYTDSVYSAPMMSSVAYQCVLLRLEDDEDVEAAKQTLLESADPRKWMCVEAESVYVENVGDVVMVLMANEPTATAIKDAFLALGE